MVFFKRIICCFVFLSEVVWAKPVTIVTLSNLSSLVKSQNLELKASRELIREAEGKLRASGRMEQPQLFSTLERSPLVNEYSFDVGVKQSFPITKRLQYETKIHQSLLEEAKLEVQQQEQQLIAQAHEAAMTVLMIEQQEIDVKQRIADMKGFVESLAQSAARGETPSLDVQLAEMNLQQFQSETQMLQLERASALGDLALLLNAPNAEALYLDGKLPKVEVPNITFRGEQRVDLKQAQAAEQTAKDEVLLEKSKRYGDVELGFFASEMRKEDLPEGFKSDLMFGFELQIPLPLRKNNQGDVDAAQAKLERKTQELTAKNKAYSNAVKAAFQQLKLSYQSYQYHQKNMEPMAQQQLEQSLEAYQRGQLPLLQLFQVQEKHYEIRQAQWDALKQFYRAHLRYQQLISIY